MRTLSIILILITTTLCEAQNNINWVKHFGGQFTDRAQHIVTDNEGQIFVCGQFTDTLSINGQFLISDGVLDGVLIKTDSSGNINWYKQFKGPKDEQLIRMVWHSSGQIIVSGSFSDSLNIGDTVIYALGFEDVFIASLNPEDGSTKWVHSFGSYYGYEFVGGLCSDFEDIYWGVNYSGTGYINGESFYCTGAYDFAIIRFDIYGNVINSNAYHGSGVDLMSAISTGGDGKLFVCGKFNDMFEADTVQVNTSGMFDIFYLSQNSDGSLNWLRSDGGYSTEIATSIAVGPNNDIYMGCWMQDSLVFQDSIMMPDPSGEIFVVKLDYEGNKVWLFRGFPDSGADQVTDIFINCKGDILFTGLTTYFSDFIPQVQQPSPIQRIERCAFGDTYIAKLNTAGELVWLKNTLGTNANLGLGITADKYGKIYVCGYFTDSMYAGIHKVKGTGGNDLMFFMLNDDEKCFTNPVSYSDSRHIHKPLLFPNPSGNEALLMLHDAIGTRVIITDIQGKIIAIKNCSLSENIITLSSVIPRQLIAGVYYIQIISSEETITLPWIYTR
jgi:hypothetical protein